MTSDAQRNRDTKHASKPQESSKHATKSKMKEKCRTKESLKSSKESTKKHSNKITGESKDRDKKVSSRKRDKNSSHESQSLGTEKKKKSKRSKRSPEPGMMIVVSDNDKEIQWPLNVVNYTKTKPSLCYSCNLSHAVVHTKVKSKAKQSEKQSKSKSVLLLDNIKKEAKSSESSELEEDAKSGSESPAVQVSCKVEPKSFLDKTAGETGRNDEMDNEITCSGLEEKELSVKLEGNKDELHQVEESKDELHQVEGNKDEVHQESKEKVPEDTSEPEVLVCYPALEEPISCYPPENEEKDAVILSPKLSSGDSSTSVKPKYEKASLVTYEHLKKICRTLEPSLREVAETDEAHLTAKAAPKTASSDNIQVPAISSGKQVHISGSPAIMIKRKKKFKLKECNYPSPIAALPDSVSDMLEDAKDKTQIERDESMSESSADDDYDTSALEDNHQGLEHESSMRKRAKELLELVKQKKSMGEAVRPTVSSAGIKLKNPPEGYFGPKLPPELENKAIIPIIGKLPKKTKKEEKNAEVAPAGPSMTSHGVQESPALLAAFKEWKEMVSQCAPGEDPISSLTAIVKEAVSKQKSSGGLGANKALLFLQTLNSAISIATSATSGIKSPGSGAAAAALPIEKQTVNSSTVVPDDEPYLAGHMVYPPREMYINSSSFSTDLYDDQVSTTAVLQEHPPDVLGYGQALITGTVPYEHLALATMPPETIYESSQSLEAGSGGLCTYQQAPNIPSPLAMVDESPPGVKTAILPPPKTGILLQAGRDASDQLPKKSVMFADGIGPGKEPVQEGVESPPPPPPPPKDRRKLKMKHRSAEHPTGSESPPPPPPPPRSPPPPPPPPKKVTVTQPTSVTIYPEQIQLGTQVVPQYSGAAATIATVPGYPITYAYPSYPIPYSSGHLPAGYVYTTQPQMYVGALPYQYSTDAPNTAAPPQQPVPPTTTSN